VDLKDETGAAELELDERDEEPEVVGAGVASGMLGLTCCSLVSTLMFLTIMMFCRNCVFLGCGAPDSPDEAEEDEPRGVMLEDIGGATPGRPEEPDDPSWGEAEPLPELNEPLPEPKIDPEPEPEPGCDAITMEGLIVSDS